VAAFCVLRSSAGGSGRFLRAARVGQAEPAPADAPVIEAA
jgi:hypothetical protein